MYSLKPIKSNNQLLAKEYDFTIDKTIPNVSDNFVNFKNDPNISNQQATFTCQPMLQYCEGKFLAKLRLRVEASRAMAKQNVNNVASPPYVLSCDNYTVPVGAVNNLISKLQISTGEEAYVHENNNSMQRQVETLINFMQYDQKKLNKEFGLHLEKDIDPVLDYKTVFGKGVIQNSSQVVNAFTGSENAQLQLYGMKNMLFDKYKWILDRNSKYSVLDREEQLDVGNYDAGAIAIPAINPTGINGYGQISNLTTLDGVTLVQTAYIDVYEYIMAPFLSTDYKNGKQIDKILTTSNNIMNVTMNFDTNYLRNMVKTASDITIISIDIESVELRNVHMFSSQEYKQALINKFELKNQSLVYTYDVSYTPDVKVPNVGLGSATPTKTTVSFTKSSQNTLSRFYLLACPLNMTQNNATQKGTNIKDIIFSNISNLRFEVTGRKTQYVLQNVSNEELIKMTSDALQNNDFWLQYLDKKNWVNAPLVNPMPTAVLDVTNNNVNLYCGNSSNVYNLTGTGWAGERRQHLSFYILDLEKLSLGTIGGVPITSGVRYNDYFSVKFSYDIDNSLNIYDYPQLMYNGSSSQTYVANPLCIPITLNLGRMNSSKQFELVPDQMLSTEYGDKFRDLLDDASYKITSAHLQFGAGFFGDLWNDIKSVASTVAPIAESVVPMIDKIAGRKPTRKYKSSL